MIDDLTPEDLRLRKNTPSTVGKRFGHWTVIKELPAGKLICRCDCGTVKNLYKKAVISGETKSCGCMSKEYMDITGKRFGEWTVLKYLGNENWLCRCSCGTERTVLKNALTTGRSKSCGCKQGENLNSTFRKLYGETCTAKISNPREQWQIDILDSAVKFKEFIDKYDHRPLVSELVDALGVNSSTILLKIHKYRLEQYIDNRNQSTAEKELLEYVQSLTSKYIKTQDKSLIPPYELDIYIPELQLAIEYNGTYWHSSIFKSPTYHREKTFECNRNAVRLIHIFEYEWVHKDTKDKIKKYLKGIISNDRNIIYARNTSIREVNNDEAKFFEEDNHLQGYTSSSINVALVDSDNKILGLMTFGKPRFDNNMQYELIRLCYRPDTAIIGGSEKMFKYFISKYNPDNIISYCNIAKFTGNIYSRLGFKFDRYTNPSYVWVHNNDSEILSRYLTQKHLLVKNGLGTEDQAEDEIMMNSGYFKLYDCGNIRYIWNRE